MYNNKKNVEDSKILKYLIKNNLIESQIFDSVKDGEIDKQEADILYALKQRIKKYNAEDLTEFKKNLNDTYLLNFLCSLLHTRIENFYTITNDVDVKDKGLEIGSVNLATDILPWDHDFKGLTWEQYKTVIDVLIKRILGTTDEEESKKYYSHKEDYQELSEKEVKEIAEDLYNETAKNLNKNLGIPLDFFFPNKNKGEGDNL